jgi:hypothetical protein
MSGLFAQGPGPFDALSHIYPARPDGPLEAPQNLAVETAPVAGSGCLQLLEERLGYVFQSDGRHVPNLKETILVSLWFSGTSTAIVG